MSITLFEVCALGNAIVDIVAEVPEAFLQQHHLEKDTMTLMDHEHISALRKSIKAGRAVRAGGSAGNMIAGIASFGSNATFLGKIAEDEIGKLFAADLRKLKVQFPTAPLKAAGVGTGLCLSLVTPDAHRSLCTYLGASTEFGVNDVPLNVVRESHMTYLEGYLLDRTASKLALHLAADTARDAGRRTVLSLCDPHCVERNRKDFLDLIHTKTNILFANEKELIALYKASNLDAAITEVAAHVNIAVITRSEKGAVIVTAAQKMVVPAESIKVVDKTGAGDLFAAGFLFGLAKQFDIPHCAKLATLAATEVIGHFGPRPEHSLAALAKNKGLL